MEVHALMKKRLAALGCFLSVLLIYTFFTTCTPNDHKNELIQFANHCVNGTDLTSSVYKDSYENEKSDGSTSLKNYEVSGDHTFIVYPSKDDCNFTPILDDQNY